MNTSRAEEVVTSVAVALPRDSGVGQSTMQDSIMAIGLFHWNTM